MNILLRKSIWIMLLFVVSCQSVESTNVPTPTLELIEVSPIETQAVIPTQDSVPISVESQESTKHFELPEWIKRSWTGKLLVLPYRDVPSNRPYKSILVNPDNGDTFIIDLQKEFYHYYWRDNEHLVFFHEGDCNGSPEFVSELSVYSGILQEYIAKDHPEYILSCYFKSNDETVRLNYELSELAVEFVDPSSGEISLLTDPDDGVTDISVELSPYGDFVAVVQFDGDFKIPEVRAPMYGNRISIYDLRSQRLILQYTEDRISSETSFIDYSNLTYMRGNTPCLIMILSLSKKCIHTVERRFPDSTIILSKNSEGSRGFRFLYFSQNQGGYCFYDIYTGGLGCPTDRFLTFSNQFVINYSLSSFGHYLLVEYSDYGCPVPWCDYPKNTQLGLINLYDGKLFELGSSYQFFISDSFRPLLPDPWRLWF